MRSRTSSPETLEPLSPACDIYLPSVRDVADDIFLLRYLPDDLKAFVRASFVQAPFETGDVLVAEGDPAEAFCLITEGRARVSRRGEDGTEVPLGQLGPGDETAQHVRRRATVEPLQHPQRVVRELERIGPAVREHDG